MYSLTKHMRERHQQHATSLDPVFKDAEGNVATLPKPRANLDTACQEGYRTWIEGLTERINSTLHPQLPGEFKLIIA